MNMDDFNPVEKFYHAEDIAIIDTKTPEEKIINNFIVLISGINEEDLKNIFKEKKVNNVFLFQDRYSLDQFKKSLLNSKEYLEEGFNMGDLIIFRSNIEEFKILKYIKGHKDFKNLDHVLAFINSDSFDVMEINPEGFFVFLFRDKDSEKEVEGYYYK